MAFNAGDVVTLIGPAWDEMQGEQYTIVSTNEMGDGYILVDDEGTEFWVDSDPGSRWEGVTD